ncbi:hypothetical protein QOT17_014876 [Balamuthia mandrillaris]
MKKGCGRGSSSSRSTTTAATGRSRTVSVEIDPKRDGVGGTFLQVREEQPQDVHQQQQYLYKGSIGLKLCTDSHVEVRADFHDAQGGFVDSLKGEVPFMVVAIDEPLTVLRDNSTLTINSDCILLISTPSSVNYYHFPDATTRQRHMANLMEITERGLENAPLLFWESLTAVVTFFTSFCKA